MTDAPRKLTNGQILAYALGVWPLTLPASSLTLSSSYYSAALGLPLAALALALTAGRVFDMVADVAMGWICDNVPTRWGRRRPWIFLGTLLFVPTLWLTLVPGPGFTPGRYAIGLFLYFAAWTMAMVPFMAHGTELTTDFADRGRINVANGAVGAVAVLVSFGIPYAVVDAHGYWIRAGLGDWIGSLSVPGATAASSLLHAAPIAGIASYGRVMLTVVILTTITAPLCVLLYAWKVPEGEPQTREPRQPLATAFRNPVFLRFSLGYLLIMTGYFGRFGLMAFIIAYLFSSPDLLLPMYIAMFGTAWLVTPVWSRLITRLERHRCVALAAAIEVLALGLFLLAPKGGAHEWIVLALAVVMGLPGQTLVTVPFLVAAECSEYSHWKTGREARAQHVGLTSLTLKIGALAAALQIAAASLLGFDPARHPAAADVASILVVLGLVVPILLMAAGAAIVMTHPINRRRTAILQRALARRAGRSTVRYPDTVVLVRECPRAPA